MEVETDGTQPKVVDEEGGEDSPATVDVEAPIVEVTRKERQSQSKQITELKECLKAIQDALVV